MCVDEMLAQSDYEQNIVALMAKDHYLRRQNKMEEVLTLHHKVIIQAVMAMDVDGKIH